MSNIFLILADAAPQATDLSNISLILSVIIGAVATAVAAFVVAFVILNQSHGAEPEVRNVSY